MIPIIFPVTCHTDHVGNGTTFVAIKGLKEDGAKYISIALEKGAIAIVVDVQAVTFDIIELCAKFGATCLPVSDTRQALAEYASAATNDAWKKLNIIGITGTKGKTTTAYLVDHILKNAGYKTAILSTIANKILDHTFSSNHTTPESDYIHQFFAACVDFDVTHVVMEVSSHALSLKRVHGIHFDAVAFTNLSVDHLDFHQTIDDYFQAKIKIFSMLKLGGICVINTDTTWGEQAAEYVRDNQKNIQLNTFGFQKSVFQNHQFLEIHSQKEVVKNCNFFLNKKEFTCSGLFGSFNVSNIAMAILLCLGMDKNIDVEKALATFSGVPGRLQGHCLSNGAYAFVDYAHNTLSFYEVLTMLRRYTDHLIVVFGCGGDRPRDRRFGMGSIAAEYADVVILTDDNPRFERSDAIINDIKSNILSNQLHKVQCIADRAKAIHLAVSLSAKNSIIALLGKGHEEYYSIQGKNYFFNDFEEIKKY